MGWDSGGGRRLTEIDAFAVNNDVHVQSSVCERRTSVTAVLKDRFLQSSIVA